jgi:hypothetical protein
MKIKSLTYSSMRNLLSERQDKYQLEIVEVLPNLGKLKPGAIVGMYSITDRTDKVRYVCKNALVKTPYGQDTYTAITRDWVAATYPPLRAHWEEIASARQPTQAPLLAKPGIYPGAFAYLDLSAAYWTLTRIYGYDITYLQGQYLVPGKEIDDYPLYWHKRARASLVSMGYSSELRMWTGKEIKTTHKWGRNVILYRAVMDALNGIAKDIITYCGVVYYHTDGCIVPSRDLDRAKDIVASWGMNCKIKGQGAVIVKGIGNYRIGRLETIPFKRGYPGGERIHEVRAIEDNDWLRKVTNRLSQYRGITQ